MPIPGLITEIRHLAVQGRMNEAISTALAALQAHPQSLELNTEALLLAVRMTTPSCAQYLGEIAARHRVSGVAALVDRLITLFADHPDRYELFAACSRVLCRQEMPEPAILCFANTLAPARPANVVRNAIVSEYASLADQYDESDAHHASIGAFTTLLGECLQGRRQGLNVIDAGCGSGLAGITLRPWAARLTGLDLSSSMLAVAEKSGLYDQLLEGDMVATLATMPESADLLVCAGATYYLRDLSPFLAAARTCLKPGGQLFFSDFPALDHMGVMETIGGTFRYARPAALTRALAAEHGFAELNCVLELSFSLPAFHWHFRKT